MSTSGMYVGPAKRDAVRAAGIALTRGYVLLKRDEQAARAAIEAAGAELRERWLREAAEYEEASKPENFYR